MAINAKIQKVILVSPAVLLMALLLASGIVAFTGSGIANADVTVSALPDAKVYDDFVVGPGKMEFELSPGETKTVQVTVANRLGTDKDFSVTVEDFTGSNDPSKTVVLLGDDHGPYSLRDYIHTATTSIMIGKAMKAYIPVTISIPADAQPGGLYGSVIVSTITKNDGASSDAGAAPSSPIITRIGTLFFVRVKGDVNASGHLSGFTLAGGHSILWSSQPMTFDLLYKNDGNVHLDPSGSLTIDNMVGSTIGTVEIEPWFAMPQSLRFREVSFTPAFMFGRYTAHVAIRRGYGSTTDEANLVFWVIPWKIVLGALVALIIVITGIRLILSKFKISRR